MTVYRNQSPELPLARLQHTFVNRWALKGLLLCFCLSVFMAEISTVQAELLKEAWRLRFINNQPAGFTCTLVYPFEGESVSGYRVVQKELLKYQHQGRAAWQRVEYSTIEQKDGQFHACDYQYTDSFGRKKSQSVQIKQDRLKIASLDNGRMFETDLLYQNALQSPQYLESLSLRVASGASFQPRDRLKWRFYTPEGGSIDTWQATLSNPRKVQSKYHPPMMLAKASFRSNLPTMDLRTYIHFDQTGTIRRKEIWRGGLHWEELSVPSHKAYEQLVGPDLDQLILTLIQVKPIQKVDKLQEISLNIGMLQQDVADYFVDSDFQRRQRYDGSIVQAEVQQAKNQQERGKLPLIQPGPSKVASGRTRNTNRDSSANNGRNGNRGEIRQLAGVDIQYEVETIRYEPDKVTTPEKYSIRLITNRAKIPSDAKITPSRAIYVADSPFLQLRDPLVRQLAERGVNPVLPPAKKVEQLVELVNRTLKRKTEMTTQLRPARDIILSEQGSPTDHAILLTSLLRSIQIPARPAVGICWHPGFGCFVPYVWTEVRLGDRWYPVDAVTGQAELSPLYLKMGDSALSEVESSAAMFAPLLKCSTNLVISVHSSNPAQKKESLLQKVPSLLP
ncbi:MAG: transglutaminase domain-containing protein [Planctomycetaceae bacterium]|nr:transglutaminase domain-containing protein [Planctomycetaceae bacterium]